MAKPVKFGGKVNARENVKAGAGGRGGKRIRASSTDFNFGHNVSSGKKKSGGGGS